MMIFLQFLGVLFLVIIGITIFQSVKNSKGQTPIQTPASPEQKLDYKGDPIDVDAALKELAEGKGILGSVMSQSVAEKLKDIPRQLRTDGLYHTIWRGTDTATGRRVTNTWLLAVMTNGYIVKLKRDGELKMTKELLAQVEATRFDFDPSQLADAGEDFCRYTRDGNNLTARFYPLPNARDAYIEFDGVIGFDKLTLDLNQYETTYFGIDPGLKKKSLVSGLKFDFYKFPNSLS